MNITFTFELASRPDRFGLHQIFLRFTAHRKHIRIKTGVAVWSSQFQNKPVRLHHWITADHPQHVLFNEQLANLLIKIRKAHFELEKSGAPVSIALLKQALFSTDQKSTMTILDYASLVISRLRVSYHYKKHMKSKLNTFAQFAGKGTLVSSINLDLLNRFKQHLNNIPVSSSTQHYYFSRIKRLVILAIHDELIEKDPFLKFEMPPERPSYRAKLSDEQIAAIEAVECEPHSWLWRAKWLYLFSYRKAGMRSADVIQLRVGNLKSNNRLEYEMDKTGKLMSMKLHDFDWRIIRMFGDPAMATQKGDYLFGLLDNDEVYARYVTFADKQRMPEGVDRRLYNKIGSVQAMINKSLKELARLAEIDEKLTFHTARHSFADKARRKMKETSKVTIDDIRNSLGHIRLETTQRYLSSLDREGLDVALDAIFDE